MSICKVHPKYVGIRKPITRKGAADGCSCHEYWLRKEIEYIKRNYVTFDEMEDWVRRYIYFKDA